LHVRRRERTGQRGREHAERDGCDNHIRHG